MPDEAPHPLHPDTLMAMRSDNWRNWSVMVQNLDQAGAEIVRVMREWPPDQHIRLLRLFEQLYDRADPEDHDRKALAALALLKLGELLTSWHTEVHAGLHDDKEGHAAGGTE